MFALHGAPSYPKNVAPAEDPSMQGSSELSRPRIIGRRWTTRGSGASTRPQPLSGMVLSGKSGGPVDGESPDLTTIASHRNGHEKGASHAIEFITSNCKGGVGHKGGIGDFYEALASLCAAESRPNEAVLQIVNSAGADGIDLHELKARIETSLQLQRSVKTLRLSKYLRAYKDFFRVETHDDGLNHVYPITAPRSDGAVQALELPLFTHGLLSPSGGDELRAYHGLLSFGGRDPGVLQLMSPADPVALAGGTTALELAALERTVGPPDRGRGGSVAGGRGSVPSGGTSDEPEMPDELRRLRTSEAALRVRTSQLTHLCSDLQLRVNDLEEVRLCTICLDVPRDTVVLPCMHAHFCGGCLRGAGLTAAATNCPTCRGFIAGTLALRLGLVD